MSTPITFDFDIRSVHDRGYYVIIKNTLCYLHTDAIVRQSTYDHRLEVYSGWFTDMNEVNSAIKRFNDNPTLDQISLESLKCLYAHIKSND